MKAVIAALLQHQLIFLKALQLDEQDRSLLEKRGCIRGGPHKGPAEIQYTSQHLRQHLL